MKHIVCYREFPVRYELLAIYQYLIPYSEKPLVAIQDAVSFLLRDPATLDTSVVHAKELLERVGVGQPDERSIDFIAKTLVELKDFAHSAGTAMGSFFNDNALSFCSVEMVEPAGYYLTFLKEGHLHVDAV